MTPDGLMERPVHELALFAARSVRRIEQWLEAGAPHDAGMGRWCDREDQIAHSCRIALTLRAGEVAAFCNTIHIHGCTEAFVRRNPFGVALAIEHQMYGDNTNGHHRA